MCANWSQNAITVLEHRYLIKDRKGNIMETPDGMLARVAKAISEAELDNNKSMWNDRFLSIMDSLEFLPNSPCLINAGRELQQLSACFVLHPMDSIESIMNTVKYTAIIHKSGGGVGLYFSNIRPANSVVKSTSGVASGPISFMKIFNMSTEVIKQGGVRRGANLGLLKCTHPDIFDWVRCKEDLTQFQSFNLSVSVTDEFLEAAKEDSTFYLKDPYTKERQAIKAKELFDLICYEAWLTGEPGLIFIDTINRKNFTPWLGPMECVNPCIAGDTLISTTKGKVAIKDLVGKNPLVFCTDGEEIHIRRAFDIRKTGRMRKVYKLTTKGFISGNSTRREIVATGDHLFMLYDGGYKKLEDLREGDRLLPFYQMVRNSKGYRNIRDINNKVNGEAHYVCKYFHGAPSDNQIPHHKDGDKTNNDPDNLEWVDNSEHNRLKMIGENNPIHKLTEEGRNPFQRNGFVSEMNKITWQDDTIRARRISGIKRAHERMGHKVHNHKVVTVEFCGYEDVYDMRVPDFHNFAANGLFVHNCGEQNLYAWESCNLGSIDISKFVVNEKVEWDRLSEVVEIAVRFLDDVIDVNNYPHIKIRRKTLLTRKVGLGIMGWADALIKLGYRYDSNKAIKLAKKLMMNIREVAHITSRDLGKEKGFCFDKLKRRNTTLTTLAPTGCQVKDNVIITSEGNKSLRDILEDNKINYYSVEKVGKKRWFDIKDISLPTNKGQAVSNKIYYNGFAKVKRIVFEDGGEYEFTENHPLLINRDGAEMWICVGELKEGENIIKFNEVFETRIAKIEDNGYKHTWDIEVLPSHCYLLSNGCVSHNTLSILADCSSGIEPLFGKSFTKTVLNGTVLDMSSKYKGVANDLLVTAHDIPVEKHIEMQAAFQSYVDNSVSKTINLPNKASVEDVRKAFLLAHESGCKGITIFRDGSRKGPIEATTEGALYECENGKCPI